MDHGRREDHRNEYRPIERPLAATENEQPMKILRYIFCLQCIVAPCALVSAADTLAIKGAKIVTLAGDPIENGVIVIRDGKIEAVGANVSIPIEAHVIDATGKVVMPGFIDAHTSDGLNEANERNEVVPFLSVVDSINPVLDYFEESRRNGVTTAAIVPGNSTIIGGQAAILKTAGQYVDDMIVKRNAGIKISLRPASGTRMSQLARLRRELDKAKIALEKKKSGEEAKPEAATPEAPKPADAPKPEGTPPEGGDASAPASATPSATDAENVAKGTEAMLAVIEGKLPVFLYCDTAMDVSAGKQLVEEYKLNAIFVLGRDCYKAAKLLSDRKQPVILDKNLVFWETNPRTRKDEKIILPKIYREANVPFVFQTSEGSLRSTTTSSSYLWYQAAIAVKHGTPEIDALKSLSLVPAQLLGIQDVVGSIEVGKDADLVVLTGDPLRLSTWVDKTIIHGKVVYDKSSDQKLKRLLSPKAE
jgi:imidazolonepropionase-like amidohydrolase